MECCCLFALPLLIPVYWQQPPSETECVDWMKLPYDHSAIQIWPNKLQMSSGDKAKLEISWEQATSHYWYGVWWPINNAGSLLGSAASFFQLIECVLARPSTTHTSDCSSSMKNDCCGNKCSTPNWISGCWLQAGLPGEISNFSNDISECKGSSPKTFWGWSRRKGFPFLCRYQSQLTGHSYSNTLLTQAHVISYISFNDLIYFVHGEI